MYQSGQELARVKKNVITTSELVLLVVWPSWGYCTRVYISESGIIDTDDLFLIRASTSWEWIANIDWQIGCWLYCPLIQNLEESSRGYIVAGIDVIWPSWNKDI